MAEETEQTLSVPEAGRRYFGVARKTAYDLAADGTIPTMRVGRLLRVPIRALERMLDEASAKPPRRAKAAATAAEEPAPEA
jgi:excisionase family DNA binding protein